MSFFDHLPPAITHSLERFQEEYVAALASSNEEISFAAHRIVTASGKKIRPLMLMLTAACFQSEVSQRIIDGAVFVELLHAATLIHDDVIDESHMRRGQPALHTLIGSHKAVLMGDYVLAVSMRKAAETGHPEVIKVLAMLGQMLIEGEFLQMKATEQIAPTEEGYFDIIKDKTASLMSMSVYIGACLAGVTDKLTLLSLASAANQLGLAFQIKDDIFDYTAPADEVGKPTGNDLREHKVTLPLIYALREHGTTPQGRKAHEILSSSQLTDEQIDFLISWAHAVGGITYAQERMEALIAEAKHKFTTLLPDTPARATLLEICDYIGTRTR